MSGDLLATAEEIAREYLASLPNRRVAPDIAHDELLARLRRPLPDLGVDGVTVLRELARDADEGLVATAGGRYFGFVIGGTLPVALAADWITSAWDQHGSFFKTSPASSVVEEVVAEWLIDLFGLPANASCGVVTGCQMANFTALAAARHAVYARAGWDVERRGLIGAPSITIVTSDETHTTIHSSLRMLGLGTETTAVAVDGEGRMRADALEGALKSVTGPLIVCAQAGNVNSGAFDPVDAIADLVHERGGWLHVDGAFGLWARASAAQRDRARGVELADSWATDAHKWLNVPYDCGIVFTRDREAHRAAMVINASYLQKGEGAERDNLDWVPEASRRARGFVLYATLRALGRDGISSLVDQCCAHARALADLLRDDARLEILNDVVLNQILVGLRDGDAARLARAMGRLQSEGELWLGGTSWLGRAAIRISVSSWMTTADDVRRAAAAIRRAVD